MKNFSLKSFWKFLGKNKLFTAINLLGFSVSIMFVILLGLYLKHELSVDKHHVSGDRVYRIEHNHNSVFPAKMARDLEDKYPEVEAAILISEQMMVVKSGDEMTLAQGMFVDSAFFRLFTYDFIEGGGNEHLRTRQDIVITERYAKKMFGNSPAVGQTIYSDSTHYMITGVIRNEQNTHIMDFDILSRFENKGWWDMNSYDACAFMIYLLERPNADLRARTGDMLEFFNEDFWLFKNGLATDTWLLPVAECYLHGNPGQSTQSNSTGFLLILAITVFSILFFAVINYINLSVAQAGFRAKQAAIRRLLGGTRAELFVGFIFESFIFCLTAFVIGLALAYLATNTFNTLLNTTVSINAELHSTNIIYAFLGVAVLSVIAGVIPAMVISDFKPIEVVRGTFRRRTKMVYSRILICFQYFITIVLIGCTFFIIRQTNYLRNADLGFDKENIIIFSNTVDSERLNGLRERFLSVAGVEAVSYTSGSPLDGGNNNMVTYDDGKVIGFQVFVADSAFLDILGLEKISETGIRNPNAVWLNEQAVKDLELEPDATTFKMWDMEEIAGIVRDFNVWSLHNKVPPVIIRIKELNPNVRPWSIMVKIGGVDPKTAYDELKAVYSDFNGSNPFESMFVDAEIDSWYDEQERTSKLIGYFSIIAIIISALGMLAMATYFMKQKATEVAIRKIYGSTEEEMLRKLVLGFMKIIMVSFVLAVPLIWYIINRWLSNYPYRINISWWVFLLAGAVAFLIAFTAVIWQSYLATRQNPIVSLKDN